MEDSVKKHAYRYSIVRFIPFPETEEFVNIGIIIACPTLGYFDFKLQQKKRHGRITHFFSDIDSDLYKRAIEVFSQELSRVQYIVHEDCKGAPDQIRKLFTSLIHPREALIQFSTSRARMATDPRQDLHKLFSYYVERNFVTQEYKEQILERKVRDLVQSLGLPKPFKPLEIGDEFAAAHFPLVQQDRSVITKVIKPFYLAQPEPSKIISHGGPWIDRLRRMRNKGTLPQSVLFAVEGPKKSEGKRFLAYQEICSDLNALDIKTVPYQAEFEIAVFASDEIYSTNNLG